jgi:hypothetical protein
VAFHLVRLKALEELADRAGIVGTDEAFVIVEFAPQSVRPLAKRPRVPAFEQCLPEEIAANRPFDEGQERRAFRPQLPSLIGKEKTRCSGARNDMPIEHAWDAPTDLVHDRDRIRVVREEVDGDREAIEFGLARRCASDSGIIQSRHSLRIVPITRSQIELALGLATGDRSTSRPNALIDRSTRLAKILSRSWIRY